MKLQIADALHQSELLIDSNRRRMIDIRVCVEFPSGCKESDQQYKTTIEKSLPRKYNRTVCLQESENHITFSIADQKRRYKEKHMGNTYYLCKNAEKLYIDSNYYYTCNEVSGHEKTLLLNQTQCADPDQHTDYKNIYPT